MTIHPGCGWNWPGPGFCHSPTRTKRPLSFVCSCNLASWPSLASLRTKAFRIDCGSPTSDWSSANTIRRESTWKACETRSIEPGIRATRCAFRRLARLRTPSRCLTSKPRASNCSPNCAMSWSSRTGRAMAGSSTLKSRSHGCRLAWNSSSRHCKERQESSCGASSTLVSPTFARFKRPGFWPFCTRNSGDTTRPAR